MESRVGSCAWGPKAGCILTRAAPRKKGLVEPRARCETSGVQEHRRHARVAASWPVTVRAGDRLLRLQTLNLSALGAKIGLDVTIPGELLPVGSPAYLRLEPPGRRPLDVEAIVWRTDDDGSAFFFVGRSHAE
ncbi:MAG: PilZ domain-containing protein [Candidatus Rokuibacteriota bacterium]